MAENNKNKKETKVFELNGENVTVKKVKDLRLKLGVIRSMDITTVEGVVSMLKLVTGKDDKFIDELYDEDVAPVMEWANSL